MNYSDYMSVSTWTFCSLRQTITGQFKGQLPDQMSHVDSSWSDNDLIMGILLPVHCTVAMLTRSYYQLLPWHKNLSLENAKFSWDNKSDRISVWVNKGWPFRWEMPSHVSRQPRPYFARQEGTISNGWFKPGKTQANRIRACGHLIIKLRPFRIFQFF